MFDLSTLEAWLHAKEDEHVEFKEAKKGFDSRKLVRYCAALANEGGGHLVLGVGHTIPRKVVGTSAVRDLNRKKQQLLDRLHLRVDVTELNHSDGRVVVFRVPSRPPGTPIEVDGAYWMRSGEDLVPMTAEILRGIFNETTPDYTAEVCEGATLADLDPDAIAEFRRRWEQKARKARVGSLSDEQLLADAELTVNGSPTYGALILFGTHRALGRFLPQAEVVFEYRSSDATGPAQQREDLRAGFFSWYDQLWELIDRRNDLQHYQEGLFIWDIPTFDEAAVRELVLNAVSHREYRLQGSVFVRQYPRRLEVVSPGGLPEGITVENILWQQVPRNRRICEAFQRCGLVERSGQGMNRVFETCIRHSNPLPDFARTDKYQVSVTLHGTVQDPRFVALISKIADEEQEHFTTEHFLAFDAVYRTGKVDKRLAAAANRLLEIGLVERVRRGELVLARRLYAGLGKRAAYTRRKGLDKETNKQLLLRHIERSGHSGAPMAELMQVLPSLTRDQVRVLLRELRAEGRATVVGRTRAARWFTSERRIPPPQEKPKKTQKNPNKTQKAPKGPRK